MHRHRLGEWIQEVCPAHNDQKPSFSMRVSQAQDGQYRLGVKCFKGCSYKAIYQALGLDYPVNIDRDYLKADGSYFYTKVRENWYGPDGHPIIKEDGKQKKDYYKGIRQPSGTVLRRKGIGSGLYNLPKVLTETGDIYVVEGEKCVDALTEQGITATSSDHGALSWKYEFASEIKHARRILIIPDNDKAGLDYLYKVVRSLLSIGYEEVYRLDLPTTVEKYDVYDWFEDGHTRAELEAVPLKKLTMANLPASSLTATESSSSLTQINSWRDKLRMVMSKDGKQPHIVPCLINYATILSCHPTWKGVFAYDSLLGEIVKLRPPIPKIQTRSMIDNDLIEIKLWINCQYPEIDPSKETINDAISSVAHDHIFNPIQDYLNSLPPWDGAPRLEYLLIDQGGVEETEFARMATKKWFIGAVARAMDPGCKMDYTLFLLGSQGHLKSAFLEAMAVNSEWYLDENRPLDSKDINFATGGKWIIEFGEMTSFKRADIEATKQFLTRKVDEWRRPYDRFPIRKPRTCVFASTRNPSGAFLSDSTGARRYWILVIKKKFDIPYIQKVRDLIWAEALHYYKASVKWWPENDYEEGLCRQVQEEYYLPDSEEERLRDILISHRYDSILTSELHNRLGISDMRINALMIDRFKCKPSKNLNELDGRGTKRGFIINREVVHAGPGVLDVRDDGLSFKRRDDDNVVPFKER